MLRVSQKRPLCPRLPKHYTRRPKVGKRAAADPEAQGTAEWRRGPRCQDARPVAVERADKNMIFPKVSAKGQGGIYVPAVIRGQHAKLLVDTGATDTFLSSALYYKISPERRPHLKTDGTHIKNADGSVIATLGSAWMEVQVGKTTHAVSATFGSFPTMDGILGMDFLLPTCGTLNFRTLELSVNGEQV